MNGNDLLAIFDVVDAVILSISDMVAGPSIKDEPKRAGRRTTERGAAERRAAECRTTGQKMAEPSITKGKPENINSKFNGYAGVINNGARINNGTLEIDPVKPARAENNKKLERPSKDTYYLNIAEQVSARSTCIRRKYGAVLVNNDRIVSTGYNGSPRGCVNCCDTGVCEREIHNIPKGERYEMCVSVHAEDNAITHAGRDQAIGSTLYIVGLEVSDGSYANPSPCTMCERKIRNCGISRIVGRFQDKETGAVTDREIHLE